jgi:AraC-like DNA-binding protein
LKAPAIDSKNTISYSRLVPISPASVLRQATEDQYSRIGARRLEDTTDIASVSLIYKQIAPGLVYFYSYFEFFEDVDLVVDATNDQYFQLEYWLVNEGCALLRDNKIDSHCHRMSRSGNSTTDQKLFIRKGTKFTNYRIVFTREFLAENFDLSDPELEGSLLRRILDLEKVWSLRELQEDELLIINGLGTIFESQSGFLQSITAKSYIMQLLQRCCEEHLAKNRMDATVQFAEVITMLEQSTKGEFPGIEKLAAAANMSVSTFKRKFQARYSTTPENYFRKLQMDEAESLLRTQRSCLKEIAHKFGFANAQNFSTSFRKVKGYLPS